MTRTETMSAPPTDGAVVAALADDLDVGFVELFNVHRQAVFSTALRVSGRWAEAQDLTAETFLRAYRALTDYDTARITALQPRPWLLTITLNLWRNAQRDASRRPATTELDSAPEPTDEHQDVEGSVLRNETARELTDLLATLPEEQRIAVVLRHVVDLPIAEIAEVLGRPEGTVKSHISRGLRRLRELTEPRPAPDSSGGLR
ncbi:MAG TPA: RNA polymerase sigma factor [Pseudonocardiaceae bacterium]|nr:RNA polymerase sigma factor [Pseudonocardiaceae bacterium]